MNCLNTVIVDDMYKIKKVNDEVLCFIMQGARVKWDKIGS